MASGEQSFLELISQKKLTPGVHYQTTTPCFRDEVFSENGTDLGEKNLTKLHTGNTDWPAQKRSWENGQRTLPTIFQSILRKKKALLLFTWYYFYWWKDNRIRIIWNSTTWEYHLGLWDQLRYYRIYYRNILLVKTQNAKCLWPSMLIPCLDNSDDPN